MNIQNLNTQDFVKLINSLRLENKNKWYTWQGIVNGEKSNDLNVFTVQENIKYFQ